LGSLLAAGIYLTAALTASVQCLYAVSLADRQHWVNRFPLAALAPVPLLTQLLFWIPPTRAFLFSSTLPQVATLLFLDNPWGRINGVYLFILIGASGWLLWNTYLERPRSAFMPFGAVLIGSLFPALAAMLDFTGIEPFGAVELVPLGFTVACCFYTFYFFQRGASLVASIDRNAVVEGMDGGWMVLDERNIVVDMNPAAERMCGRPRTQVLGQPVMSVLTGVPNLAETFNRSQEVEMKRSLRSEAGWKYLNIRLSPLNDRKGKPFGRIALWHDVTERRLTEDARQRARDEMLVLLNAISSAASNVVDLEDFLSDSIYHIIYPFRSQVVGIFLLDDRTDRKHEQGFVLSADLGLSSQAQEDLANVPATSPLFAAMLSGHEPLQIEDVDADDRLPAGLHGMGLACLLMIPLVNKSGEDSQVLGCVCIGRKEQPAFSPDEIVRLVMISDQIAMLIDNDRRRKLAITASERKRVMRDLHDSVSQKLYGLLTMTEVAQAAIEAGTEVDMAEIMTRIGENARQAVKEMRLFLFQMQPIDMEKDGLVSLLHHRLAAVEGRADIKAQFRADLTDDDIALSNQTELILYYIVMEALNNVLKHAAAKTVLVTLKQGRRNVILEVLDDGCGFDPKQADRDGLGLVNMRERTAQIHGKLQISPRQAGGTKVVITVPRDPTIKASKRRR
jgi:PAS domain S-box-containing protein